MNNKYLYDERKKDSKLNKQQQQKFVCGEPY